MDFIAEQIMFYAAIGLALFLPGYAFLLAVFGKRAPFSSLEKLTLSAGLSLVLLDIILLIIARFGALLNRLSVLSALLVFAAACLAVFYLRKDKFPDEQNAAPAFSRNQLILIIALLFLTVFFKATYLKSNILPSSTDLGHHIYWSKLIAATGAIPEYGERKIVEADGHFTLSDKEPISDFIIGEHLVFSAVHLISGIDFLSYFPILLLLLINVFSVLAIFILALRMFESHPQGKNIAILALFLIGPLFAISSPQAKYVSGGVIGNIFGNLLLPLILYFVFRAIHDRKASFLASGLLLALGLFYTHHLTAFIFIFSLIFSLAILLLLLRKESLSEIKVWLGLFARPITLSVLAFGALFFIFVAVPDYIRNSAVETVVGAPSRSTKEGLTFDQIKDTVGESRLALGLVGLVILLFFTRENHYQRAIVGGWFLAIFLMTWQPGWLHIDIPSIRIANYLIFPSMLAGAAAWGAFSSHNLAGKDQGALLLSRPFIMTSFLLLFVYVSMTGFFDNAQSLKDAPTDVRSVKTFAVAEYLAAVTAPEDVIVKDHNYVSADSWMKVFLLRDYNMPLTRGFFFRYEPPYRREKCTLEMISSPDSPLAHRCFADLGVDFVVINPQYDKTQFERDPRFWPVYTNKDLTVYYRQP